MKLCVERKNSASSRYNAFSWYPCPIFFPSLLSLRLYFWRSYEEPVLRQAQRYTVEVLFFFVVFTFYNFQFYPVMILFFFIMIPILNPVLSVFTLISAMLCWILSFRMIISSKCSFSRNSYFLKVIIFWDFIFSKWIFFQNYNFFRDYPLEMFSSWIF